MGLLTFFNPMCCFWKSQMHQQHSDPSQVPQWGFCTTQKCQGVASDRNDAHSSAYLMMMMACRSAWKSSSLWSTAEFCLTYFSVLGSPALMTSIVFLLGHVLSVLYTESVFEFLQKNILQYSWIKNIAGDVDICTCCDWDLHFKC